MFLHSGASLHGHEYSPRRTISAPGQPPKRRPLLKTALRPLANPPNSTDDEYFMTSHKSDWAQRQRASVDGTYRSTSRILRQRAASNSLTSRKDSAVRFLQAGGDSVLTCSASEDEESVAGSECTDGTADTSTHRRRRKRIPRESTRYALAQPAPQLRTKQRRLVQIRPRVLLQLQEIGDRRAIPAFDLIPSHLVAGSLIIPRLAKRFPRIFHADAELSQNDVLLVHNEDYGSISSPMSSMSSEDDKRSDHSRDVLAVISGGSGRSEAEAEIVLEDGQSWCAVPMLNGSFQFTRTDEDGHTTTARWVRRSIISTPNDAGSIEPSSTRSSLQSPMPDSKWTFSVIDPSSRRHPIMGTLTAETMEIYGSYTTLSASSGRYPPTRPFSPERSGYYDRSYSQAGHTQESRTTQKVPSEYKTLMIATASWIRLQQQGWPASANPKYSRSASVGLCPIRRQTFPSYDGDSSRAASPLNLQASSDSTDDVTSCRRRSQQKGPERVMSTGRAYMKRRNPRIEDSTMSDVQNLSKRPHVTEKQSTGRNETNPGCLTKVRQWTHKLFRGKKES